MEKLELNAELRGSEEKLRELRVSRIIPAVVYWGNQESLSIKVDATDLLRTFRKAGESTIITLKVDGKDIDVLFHDTQKEPLSWEFIHIDFYAITRGQKLTTKIHLNFIGNSEAEKEGAIISENVKELEVSCLPKDLVEGFDVDLSLLKKEEDVIKLSDLGIDTEKYEIHYLHSDDAIAVANKSKVETISDEAPESTLPEGAEEKTESK